MNARTRKTWQSIGSCLLQIILWGALSVASVYGITSLALLFPLCQPMVLFLSNYRLYNLLVHLAISATLSIYNWFRHRKTQVSLFKRLSKNFITFAKTWIVLATSLTITSLIYALITRAMQTNIIYHYLTPPPILPFILSALITATLTTFFLMLMKRWAHAQKHTGKANTTIWLLRTLSTLIGIPSVGALIGIGLYFGHTFLLPSGILLPTILSLSPLTTLILLGTALGLIVGLVLLFFFPNTIHTPRTIHWQQIKKDLKNFLLPVFLALIAYTICGAILSSIANGYILLGQASQFLTQIALYGTATGIGPGLLKALAVPTVNEIKAKRAAALQNESSEDDARDTPQTPRRQIRQSSRVRKVPQTA